jgi:hypothetical protein
MMAQMLEIITDQCQGFAMQWLGYMNNVTAFMNVITGRVCTKRQGGALMTLHHIVFTDFPSRRPTKKPKATWSSSHIAPSLAELFKLMTCVLNTNQKTWIRKQKFSSIPRCPSFGLKSLVTSHQSWIWLKLKSLTARTGGDGMYRAGTLELQDVRLVCTTMTIHTVVV